MSDTAYTPAPTLQRIRELQAQRVSLRDIAEILTAEGVPLPGRRKTWHHTAVRTCLKQPASAPSAPASPPIEASGRFWPRTRWGGGLLGGVWGAEVTIGVGLLAVWWTL